VLSESCAHLNPFLGKLASRGVQLLEEPTTEQAAVDNKCGFEWEEHGTCCRYQSLVDYAKKDRNNTVNAAFRINDALHKVRFEFMRFKKLMEDFAKNKDFMANSQLASMQSFVKFLSSNQSEKISLWLVNLGGLELKYETLVSCIETVNRIRTGSLCSVCSGRSSEWFLDDKALISEDNCHLMLDTCKERVELLAVYWLHVEELFERLNQAELHSIHVSVEDTRIAQLLGSLDHLASEITAAKIGNLTRNYYQNPTDTKATADLCESIVTIIKKPFIENFEQVFKMLQSYFEQLNTFVSHLTTNHLQAANSWKVRSRKLFQAELDFRTFLQGDVKAVPRIPPPSEAGTPVGSGLQHSNQDVNGNERFLHHHQPLPIRVDVPFP